MIFASNGINTYICIKDRLLGLKINKAAYHLIFWLAAYFFWIFIFRNGTLVLTHTITIQFCYLAFISLNYYFNTGYTIPKLLNKSRYLAFTVCFIAGIVV